LKILGGIGYILSIIPVVNIVAPVLIGIAWFQAGRNTGQSLFKATGVLMIVTFVALMGVLAFFFGSIFSILLALPVVNGFKEITPDVFFTIMPDIVGIFAAFILGAIMLAALGMASFVLEVASHFRAGTVFRSAWFRRAGWMRIIVILLIVVFVAVFIALFVASPMALADFGSLGGTYFLLLLPLQIGALLSNIFSAVAFLTAPE